MGVRVGSAGRRRVHGGDAARGGPRRELDRYGGGVRARTLGRARRQAAARLSSERSALRLHQMRARLGRAESHDAGLACRRGVVAAARSRTVAHPPRGRADRSLSNALAGGGWHADRGLLADATRPEGGREGPSGRPLESQGRSYWNPPSGSAMSTRCNRRSLRFAATRSPRNSRGARHTARASSSTARCNRVC